MMEDSINFIKIFYKKEFWKYIISGNYIIKVRYKHLILPFLFLAILSVLATLLGDINNLIKLENNGGFIDKFLYLISHHWFIEAFVFITLFFIENIRNQMDIEEIQNGKFRKALFELIDNTIVSSLKKDDKEGAVAAIKEKIHYLQYANQQIGKSLSFKPDSESINMLQEANAIISITEAEPIKWQNPTYNFYLINNLLASLSKKINNHADFASIKYTSENESFLNEFLDNKLDMLTAIGKLESVEKLLKFFKDNPATFRFYWITEENFKLNKNIIELLIAYHNLFGSYIIFISPEHIGMHGEVETKSRLKTIMDYHQYDIESNNGEVDLAFGIKDESIEIVFRRKDELIKEQLSPSESELLLDFLRDLANRIKNIKDESKLILYFTACPEGFTKNRKYCHLYLEKKEDNTDE